MNILFSPSIRELYKGQFEYSFDKRWIKFLSDTYGKINLILPDKGYKNIDLIVLSGGNDILIGKKTKKNKLRYLIDNKIYKFGISNNIPVIGICYGAQFIAQKLNCKVTKVKNHIGDHNINFENINSKLFTKKRKIKVNSFHNFGIVKYSKKIIPLALAGDNSVELFRSKYYKLLGMMWHPERFNRTRSLEKQIFLNFYKNK